MDAATRVMLSDPFTWAAAAVSLGFGLAMASWFPLGLLGGLGVAAASILAFGAWLAIAGRSGRYAERLRALWRADAATVAAAREGRIDALREELAALSFQPGLDQLDALAVKHRALVEVVDRRLDAGELAYGRFLGVAEQVYLASIDNLADVAIALRSVSTVDRPALEARLGELRAAAEARGGMEAGADDAIATRIGLLEAQEQRIAGLMSANEEALTALMRTATELAQTRTRPGEARVAVDVAVEQLERLASGAHRYAVRD